MSRRQKSLRVRSFTVSDLWGRTIKPGSRSRCLLISGLVHLVLLTSLQVVSTADQVDEKSVQFFASPPYPEAAPLMMIPKFDSEEFLQSHSNSTVKPDSELEIAPVSAELPSIDPISHSTLVRLDAPSMRPFPITERASVSQSTVPSQKHQEGTSFHGIKGYGRNFIFVIDCSRSMGSRFDMARKGLIEALLELDEQYSVQVIFFDRYIHLPMDDFGQVSANALPATKGNVERLIRWIASIQLGPGGSPHRALTLALETEPDLIYLLSDGEFSVEVVSEITQHNQRLDGFGDPRRVSVIHTIDYGAVEKDSALRELARLNGGKYLPYQ